jgi:SAM-dependent methyltransferase
VTSNTSHVTAQTGELLACPVCEGVSSPDDRFAPDPLRRCASCGFTFLDPSGARVQYDDEYFENYAGGDYLGHEIQRRHESRLRLDSLALICPPPGRLLEVGAAAGFFLDEARMRGYDGFGIEANPEMAAQARQTLGLDVVDAQLEDVELEAEAFDLACAFHVIEHLPEPLPALRRITRAVRRGGWVVVEVPNAASVAARRLGRRWQPLDLPYHVGHHGPRSLAELMERAGLEVVQIDTVPFAHYVRGPRLLVAARGVSEAMRTGGPPMVRPDPSRHQLLRGLARRPPS